MSFPTCCWRGHQQQGASMLPTVPTYAECSFNSFSKQSCLHTTACLLDRKVLPAAFTTFKFQQALTCHWNKFGSKCEALGADRNSRTAGPGTSCSTGTVLRIGFMMDHQTVPTEHCATRANSKMRPEDVLMHHDLKFGCMFFTGMRGLCKVGLRLNGRPGAQGFRKLAPQKSLKLQCSSKMSINSMQRKHQAFLQLADASTCLNMSDRC